MRDRGGPEPKTGETCPARFGRHMLAWQTHVIEARSVPGDGRPLAFCAYEPVCLRLGYDDMASYGVVFVHSTRHDKAHLL